MNRKLLLIALLAACSVQAAEVYKWVDANGIVHYSDAPPPPEATKVEKMRVGGGVVAADTTANPNSNEGEGARKDDADKDKDKAKPAPQPPATVEDTPENRAKLCTQAQNNVELLQSKYTVSAPSAADGSQQVMDDKARQARLASEQQNVATYCK